MSHVIDTTTEPDLTPGPLTYVPAPDPILAMIERAAKDPAVDIDKFERLMAMQERVHERRAKAAFDNAIAAAKGEFGPIVKNRSVNFESPRGRTTYRFEDLFSIAAVVDHVLAKHGLSYRYRSEQTGNRLKVFCRISHRDGYSEENPLEAENDTSGNKNSIQGVGSVATYLQRYSLKLSLGLAVANDDDGRLGKDDAAKIDVDQLAYVETMLRDTASDVAKFLATLGCADISNMTIEQFKRGVALLEEKKRRAARAAQ